MWNFLLVYLKMVVGKIRSSAKLEWFAAAIKGVFLGMFSIPLMLLIYILIKLPRKNLPRV